MRISKAAVVTTGAIATLAIIGATPALASTGSAAKNATSFGQVQSGGKHMAADSALSPSTYGMNGGGSWGAPWNNNPAPLIGVLNGSVVNAVPWQICGSTVMAGIGGSVPLNSPNTVLGGCNNANTVLIGH
jgi:hypothetical protein